MNKISLIPKPFSNRRKNPKKPYTKRPKNIPWFQDHDFMKHLGTIWDQARYVRGLERRVKELEAILVNRGNGRELTPEELLAAAVKTKVKRVFPKPKMIPVEDYEPVTDHTWSWSGKGKFEIFKPTWENSQPSQIENASGEPATLSTQTTSTANPTTSPEPQDQ